MRKLVSIFVKYPFYGKIIILVLLVGGIASTRTWLHKVGDHKAYQLLSILERKRKYRELHRNDWDVIDGPSATLTPDSYRDFINQSRGEISTAKNVYTALHTGWFSCRSACYLAAGKPVVVQDTGFSNILSCGEGLLTFSSLDEAK